MSSTDFTWYTSTQRLHKVMIDLMRRLSRAPQCPPPVSIEMKLLQFHLISSLTEVCLCEHIYFWKHINAKSAILLEIKLSESDSEFNFIFLWFFILFYANEKSFNLSGVHLICECKVIQFAPQYSRTIK